MTNIKNISLLLFSLSFVVLPICASAKEAPTPEKPLTGQQKNIKHTKLLGDLSQLQLDWEKHLKNPKRGIFSPSNPMLKLKNGFIRVDAIATNNANALKTKLQALGMRKISVYGKYISGDFLVSSLGKASKLSELRSMRLIGATTHQPTKSSGNFASQQVHENEVQPAQIKGTPKK